MLGKSAGGGVALAFASEMRDSVAALALWGSALKNSQWFRGPKADTYFERILSARQISFDRVAFQREICDPIDYVEQITAPVLFACAYQDQYASQPSEADPFCSVEDQTQLLHYAVNARYARATAIKGAEHTMHKDAPAWPAYARTLVSWFEETLKRELFIE